MTDFFDTRNLLVEKHIPILYKKSGRVHLYLRQSIMTIQDKLKARFKRRDSLSEVLQAESWSFALCS